MDWFSNYGYNCLCPFPLNYLLDFVGTGDTELRFAAALSISIGIGRRGHGENPGQVVQMLSDDGFDPLRTLPRM